MEINDILLEWSYRLKKGYPTMKDGKFTEPSELKVLHEILKENGISDVMIEAEEEVSNDKEIEDTIKTPKAPKEIAKLKDVTYTNESTVEACREQFEKTLMVANTLGPKTLGKLHNRMAVFSLYLPIYEAMKVAGFEAIIEKGGKVSDRAKDVATGLQSKLEDLDPKGYANFVKFLNAPKQDKPIFPDGDGEKDTTGNLKTLLDDQEVAEEILDAVASYADTEGGRGVGMGEYMMAMSFSNIWNSTGAGDLAMGESRNASENLELKGYKARLGPTGENIATKVQEKFENLAGPKPEEEAEVSLLGYLKAKGYDPDNMGGQGQITFVEFFIAAYKEASSKQKADLIKSINETNFWAQEQLGGKVDSTLKVTAGDMEDDVKLTNKLGAQGLCAYMIDKKQQRFIAFDYGKGRAKGDYIFGKGGGQAVALQFSKHPTQIFQNWRFKLPRPRIIYKK